MSQPLYRALLRLYPASVRAEYGTELVRAFDDANRGRGSVATGFAAIADVVPNALAAHGAILRQDLAYAVRTMGRSRGFVVTLVLVTALGVGANTATFSVADFVLRRPLPFPNSHELVRLCEGPKDNSGWGCMNEMSPANFRDVANSATRTRGWGAFHGAEANLVGMGEPLRISGAMVADEVFRLLGVAPMLGRYFDGSPADESSIVLSYRLWQTQFGGDQNVVGNTIRLDDRSRVIIGVMPQSFNFPSRDVQLWMPLILADQVFENRNNNYLQSIGRLAPGATFEQARAEMQLIATRLQRDFPESNAETGFSFFKQRDQVFPRNRLILLGLCGASLCLLLLTGANMANLLLVRASARERELAVRAALGAGRERLVRQMLTESSLLALLGGLAGVLVAAIAMPLLAYLVPNTLPLAEQPRLDLRALLIALGFTTLTGIGFGLIPAMMLGRRDGFTALREGGRGGGGNRQRLRSALVTLEVAVSIVLLVSSGFLIRALWKVQAVDPGFTVPGVLTLRTTLPPDRATDTLRRVEFYDAVLAGVQALPGVEAAAYTSGLPMVLTGGITGIELPGVPVRPGEARRNGVSFRLVSPQFFTTLRLPVRRGRAIEPGDRMGRTRVAVVSEAFAEQFWPKEEAIGKTFVTRGRDYTVVGIVADIKVRGLERTSEPQLYIAAAQSGQVGGLYIPKDLIVRVGDRGLAMVPSIRDVVRRVDRDQPISEIRMLSDVVDRQTADRKAQLHVLTALAALALLLTAVGIHGLLAFMVAQRSREIGVRLALGAEPGRVARMIMGEAGRLTIYGAIPGLIGAYLAAKATSALFFGIPPGDPLTLALGVLVVMVATFAGSIAPALRAVKVSPLEAIRSD